jgi:hypothetical protein
MDALSVPTPDGKGAAAGGPGNGSGGARLGHWFGKCPGAQPGGPKRPPRAMDVPPRGPRRPLRAGGPCPPWRYLAAARSFA